jgi:hypothetical protein
MATCYVVQVHFPKLPVWGIVEDDPEGLASRMKWDGKFIIVRLWVKEAADKSTGQNASELTVGIA